MELAVRASPALSAALSSCWRCRPSCTRAQRACGKKSGFVGFCLFLGGFLRVSFLVWNALSSAAKCTVLPSFTSALPPPRLPSPTPRVSLPELRTGYWRRAAAAGGGGRCGGVVVTGTQLFTAVGAGCTAAGLKQRSEWPKKKKKSAAFAAPTNCRSNQLLSSLICTGRP